MNCTPDRLFQKVDIGHVLAVALRGCGSEATPETDGRPQTDGREDRNTEQESQEHHRYPRGPPTNKRLVGAWRKLPRFSSCPQHGTTANAACLKTMSTLQFFQNSDTFYKTQITFLHNSLLFWENSVLKMQKLSFSEISMAWMA